MGWAQMIFSFLRSLLRDRTELAAEYLALQQQLAVLAKRFRSRLSAGCIIDIAEQRS